jgi:hypothetical protein
MQGMPPASPSPTPHTIGEKGSTHQMTEAQVNANRENAKKSSGPKTDAGKANSSRNATKHGLTGANPLLPGEDPDGLQRLRDDLCNRFRPVGDGEEMLVYRIADAQWRLSRVFHYEAGIYRDNFYAIAKKDEFRELRYNRQKADAEAAGEPLPTPLAPPDPDDLAARAFNMDCAGPNSLVKLSRYETALERSIDRCIKQLQVFQTARNAQKPAEAVPEPAPTPSESTNCKTNPESAAEAPPSPAAQPVQRNATLKPAFETDPTPPEPPDNQ